MIQNCYKSIHSSIHSSIHPSIHSFIHSSIHSCSDWVNLRDTERIPCIMLVTKAWSCKPWSCRFGVAREACCGPPTASPPQRHWCTVGVLVGTHQCATESRMTLWQSANPVRAVGASPVILSPACERVCELVLSDGVPHCKTVILQTHCDSSILWNVGTLTH